MGAREKLNQIYLSSILGIAAVAGLLTQSTLIFCVALSLLIAINIHGGTIRPRRPRR